MHDSEAIEFLSLLANAKRNNPRGYRRALGIIYALYLVSNPKPRSRRKVDRELHASIKAKVRKVDFVRAQDFSAEMAKAEAMKQEAYRRLGEAQAPSDLGKLAASAVRGAA
jgi:hypothetical protein